MKKLVCGVVLGWLLVSAGMLRAEQPISDKVVQPQVLLDNDKYIVQRYVLEPGEGTPVHPHNREHIAIVIRGSKLRYRDINGNVTEAVMATEPQSWFRPSRRIHS